MEGRLGDVAYNLAQVRDLLTEAVGQGAAAIALPEFFTTTIALDRAASVRDCVLPPDNAALDLLTEFATDHSALIGGSYLEQRSDGDVYNCYLLVHPDGTVTRHDKDLPTMVENAFYVGGATNGVHTTEMGSVGTGVCWETIRSQTARRMKGQVDFLMTGSHWWTVPSNWPGSRKVYDKYDADARAVLAGAPAMLSRLLGVANLHGSHCGELHGLFPISPRRFVPHETSLLGEAQIVDNAGAVVARMSQRDGAGVIVADIDLTRATPIEAIPDSFWLGKVGVVGRLLWWHQNAVGKRIYARQRPSPSRR